MAPNTDTQVTGVLFKSDIQTNDGDLIKDQTHQNKTSKLELILPYAIWFSVLHLGALYGLYLSFTEAKWQTNLFAIACYTLCGLGISAGTHRLWTHRSYKAKLPLRIFLMLCNTMAFQNTIFVWVRDHRQHHKYSETDADPYNASRGFLYSHVGWLCSRKSEEVKRKGKQIDMSDILADSTIVFQKKYYMILMPIFCILMPTMIPMYFWKESFICSFFVPTLLRYTIGLNATWAVNSFAHLYGHRSYDANINPRENLGVSLMTFGEGFHNYHHAFPWDYKSAELPFFSLFNQQCPNISTAFIDLMALIGQATDLNTAPVDMIKKRTIRTGDGTHKFWGSQDKHVN